MLFISVETLSFSLHTRLSLHTCVSLFTHVSLSSHMCVSLHTCVSLFTHVCLSSHMCLSLCLSLFTQESLSLHNFLLLLFFSSLFPCFSQSPWQWSLVESALSLYAQLTYPECQSPRALAHSLVGELLASCRKNLHRCCVVCVVWCVVCGVWCVLCVVCCVLRPF